MSIKKDEALLRALGVLAEAANYTSSESWSPSLTGACERVIDYIKEALNEQPTQPRQWQGLTNEELMDLTAIYSGAPLYCAIEIKLKEKNA